MSRDKKTAEETHVNASTLHTLHEFIFISILFSPKLII